MIEVKNIIKHYPGFELNCSLKSESGRITGVIGQNGAGKSTLFRIILSLAKAEEGTVVIDGQDIRTMRDQDREKIGTVMADSTFSGYLTIDDVRILLKQFYPTFDEGFFVTKCRESGLNPKAKINDLSTGMKAKLKVLSAISHKADLLVLDEPTAGLDVIARDDVLDLLRDYMEQNPDACILISSHISSDLENLCDDIYMIHNGKIVLHEDTDRLLSDYCMIKADQETFEKMDKQYLLKVKKEPWGYQCLSNERAFYQENYPDTVIEKTGIDELMLLMIKGETV